MRTLLLILISVSAGAQSTVFPGISKPWTVDWAGKTTYFFGDSFVYGVNASPRTTNRWTTLFSSAKGTTESNSGVSGQTMQTNGCGGSTFNASVLPIYNSSTDAALFIALGLNDVGEYDGVHDTTGYGAAMRSALTTAISTKGWPYYRIFVIEPYWCYSYTGWLGFCGGAVTVPAPLIRQTDYNASALANATAYRVNFVQVYNWMKGNLLVSDYDTDQLHLVNSGHSKLAAYIASVLY